MESIFVTCLFIGLGLALCAVAGLVLACGLYALAGIATIVTAPIRFIGWLIKRPSISIL